MRELVLVHGAGGEIDDRAGDLGLGRAEGLAVELEEQDADDEPRPLVAVGERVIAHDTGGRAYCRIDLSFLCRSSGTFCIQPLLWLLCRVSAR